MKSIRYRLSPNSQARSELQRALLLTFSIGPQCGEALLVISLSLFRSRRFVRYFCLYRIKPLHILTLDQVSPSTLLQRLNPPRSAIKLAVLA